MIFEDFRGKAYNYLSGTYTRCRHQPTGVDNIYFINKADGRGGLDLYESTIKDPIRITKNLQEWEFFTPKLGYICFADKWHYVVRKANRSWHVGICRSNTDPRVDQWGLDSVITGLRNAKNNKYEVPSQALISSKYLSGISQKYAIGQNKLWYCGEEVGKILQNKVEVQSVSEQIFHSNNIRSLIGLDFVVKHVPNPLEEDY